MTTVNKVVRHQMLNPWNTSKTTQPCPWRELCRWKPNLDFCRNQKRSILTWNGTNKIWKHNYEVFRYKLGFIGGKEKYKNLIHRLYMTCYWSLKLFKIDLFLLCASLVWSCWDLYNINRRDLLLRQFRYKYRFSTGFERGVPTTG